MNLEEKIEIVNMKENIMKDEIIEIKENEIIINNKEEEKEDINKKDEVNKINECRKNDHNNINNNDEWMEKIKRNNEEDMIVNK